MINKFPQIQPHYSVEVIEPKHVYLLGEQSTHALTGQLYCKILPLLNGQYPLDEIYQKLDGQVLREHIDFVLERLDEKGYLTVAAPDLSPGVAAFWSALGVPPTLAARGLQQQQVNITTVGSIGDLTRASLAQALRDTGVCVNNTYSSNGKPQTPALKVVLTDDYLQPQLREINQKALSTGEPWLLVKAVGNVLWLGPIFVPSKTGCYDCLTQRLRGNREVEASVLRQKQKRGEVLGCLPTARGTLPSTLQMGLQFAATEIAKWVVQTKVKETTQESVLFPTLEGKIITFNQINLEMKTHALPFRPQCPSCGNGKLLQERGFQPVILEPQPKHFTRDGGHRAVTPSQTVEKYQHLIGSLTGIVTELVRISDPGNPLVHTYRAGHSFGSATSLRGLRHALRHKSSGKGKSDSQSRASGFCEAVERYSGIYQGDEPSIKSTIAELGGKAIHPERCLLFSDRQYENREKLNEQATVAHDWIPQRFNATKVVDWTPVWSLIEESHKYLPTAFCYYEYPRPKDHRFCHADSNGNAAGNTIEEAILQGFLELVERDSVSIWWYNQLQRPEVDLSSFDEPYFLELQHFYRQNNRDLWVLDLTADLGIPTFAGVSRRIDGGAERIIAGFGAHLDPTIAILRAMTEVNQLGLELDKIPAEQLPGEFKDWMLGVTLENHAYFAPDKTAPLKLASDYPQRWGSDIKQDVITCVEIAREAGLETLVLDQTRPDIGLNVVKVIIPGMRHFWSRFGAGRLYDVPVKLGWLDIPLSEQQMNSTAMPF
ncbi:bacteriocin biosynthesis cyclodehydratase domain protein [Rivularia sp. PCC 7116]|uniref:TOMM precursor leader peptide-binding protein n=1 Tax=Rivularia sp. PCC 7116 TaxID=373994 RepID=UPI00029EE117|nr:TOMM precursor leader peptide-binding protein [Rivularia sp. PCC 7116]AFY58676.1 bacteriocin biosynthesis cyclodehydratase domain protein [Rivularia sp. PCC 7116]